MFVEAKLFHKANESGGGGSGAVDSVNGKTGVVVLTGADIDATVAGITDTVTDHITTLKNDLGDLGDVVSTKAEKVEITLTGESGTLTAEQISALTNADNVVSIVCDGQQFYLSNKDSTLTYRTYINTDCAVNSDVEFKAIYVQLNSEAANYGAWTLEEVSTGGGGLPDPTGHSGEFLTTDGTNASWSNKVVVDSGNKTVSNGCYAIFNGTSRGQYGSIAVGGEATGTESVTVGGSSTGGRATSVAGRATGGYSVAFGRYANATAHYSTVIGTSAEVQSGSDYGIVIGYGARLDYNKAHAIQIGSTGSYTYNPDANTMKVANANGNFELMSADGTIPAARHASLPQADGTYVLKLVITDGVPTLSWVAE